MAAGQLLSKLAAISTFVVFPASIVAYALYVPDKHPKKDTAVAK